MNFTGRWIGFDSRRVRSLTRSASTFARSWELRYDGKESFQCDMRSRRPYQIWMSSYQ